MKFAMTFLMASALAACTPPGETATETGGEPASEYTLVWENGDTLRLDADVLTPNGCYMAGGEVARRAPDGAVAIESAVAVTLPLAREGEMCTMALKVVSFSAVIDDVPPDAATLIVYELWPEGEPLRPRALALPPRR